MNKHLTYALLLPLVLLLYISLTGCITTSRYHLLGEDATITPGIDRISASAKDAAFAPHTWLPLATAALIVVTNTDEKIQDWAATNTPVFGSTSNAKKYSDYFLNASTWVYVGSLLIAPGGEQIQPWIVNKTKGLAVGAAAILTTQFLTQGLKTMTGRERPDGSDDRSFPSGHTSGVAVNMMLGSRNIEYLALNPYLEGSLNIALHGMTLATGWARIEGNKHYPTDILFSAALGNFIGAFINDAFLGRYSKNVKLSASINQSGSSLNLYVRF